jgi:hypothetical protein
MTRGHRGSLGMTRLMAEGPLERVLRGIRERKQAAHASYEASAWR